MNIQRVLESTPMDRDKWQLPGLYPSRYVAVLKARYPDFVFWSVPYEGDSYGVAYGTAPARPVFIYYHRRDAPEYQYPSINTP